MAHRHLGTELGGMYIDATEAQSADEFVFEMTPEHWRTTDYAKEFGQPVPARLAAMLQS